MMKDITTEEAFDLFKPERLIFVISSDKDGKPNGMAAAWCMKCSMEPPMIAVTLQKAGNTQRLIRESKEFVIAAASNELEKELMFFRTTHGNQVDKFKETGIDTEKPKVVNVPLIKKAFLNFECKLENEVDSGDHIIFIGRIVASHQGEGKGILLNLKEFSKVGPEISKDAIVKIKKINELSFKLNGEKEGTTAYTLESMKHHAQEINDLFYANNEHWAVETGDLMVHCMKLLQIHGYDINEYFDKCCSRFESKITKLLGEKNDSKKV